MESQPEISRRAWLIRCALLFIPALARARENESSFAGLESRSGVRLGVMALDTGSGRTIAYRAEERFLFCSTWKFLVAAAVLARVDRRQESLARVVRVRRGDLVPHAPVTERHLTDGMTLDGLCEAAITVSDNTAANLLLEAVGGIGKFNEFVRALGDRVTTLNRNEPTLNDPDGVKDTTTPHAMLEDMRTILLGDVLKPESRRRLLHWLEANTTGGTMLRAGLPASWKVGDKTGHGDTASNDIAIVMPPGRKPILITAYTHHARNAQAPVAEMARIVAAEFAR